jgi:hypothetical protein
MSNFTAIALMLAINLAAVAVHLRGKSMDPQPQRDRLAWRVIGYADIPATSKAGAYQRSLSPAG